MSGVWRSDSRGLAALSHLPYSSAKRMRQLWAPHGIILAGMPILQHSGGGSHNRAPERGGLAYSELNVDQPAYSAASPRSRSMRNN